MVAKTKSKTAAARKKSQQNLQLQRKAGLQEERAQRNRIISFFTYFLQVSLAIFQYHIYIRFKCGQCILVMAVCLLVNFHVTDCLKMRKL
jgi:hypothetical protein